MSRLKSNNTSQIRNSIMRHYADWRVNATAEEKHAHRTTNEILFTFDDYGTASQIHKILNILNKSNIRAHFYMIGAWAYEHPELINDIRKSGHIIGNHSYSHSDMLKLRDNEITSEITSGITSNKFRPPRGRYNKHIRKIAASLGQSIIYWSIDSEDWKDVSQQYIFEKVVRNLHPGAVILFHAHRNTTINLLPRLISEIRAQGYTIENFGSEKYS